MKFTGFLPLLEIRENWKAFFHSGKSQGIWHFLKKSGKNQGILHNIFLYFDDTIYFHGCKGRITAGRVRLRCLYSAFILNCRIMFYHAYLLNVCFLSIHMLGSKWRPFQKNLIYYSNVSGKIREKSGNSVINKM